MTHPPTSEFSSDFLDFFNLTKPLNEKDSYINRHPIDIGKLNVYVIQWQQLCIKNKKGRVNFSYRRLDIKGWYLPLYQVTYTTL